MGRISLVGRLAARDLRRRPGQALLLLVVIAAAMATLTLGLILHGVTSQPYDQTRAATAGPDVAVSSVGFPASDLSRFAALAHASGVTAHSGPYPVAWPVLRANGITVDAMAEGRDATPAVVDQPKVIQGTWVRSGGVVVERAFADALGVHIGGHVTLDGRTFPVTGIAVTAAVPVFSQVCFYGGCSSMDGKPPSFDTGLVWLTQAAARSLAVPGDPLTYYLNLRLADPAAAPAFVSEHQPPPGTGPAPLTAWQSLRGAAAALVADEQQVLLPASWLLALLAMASTAVVAGGRMAEQEKRVGLLKAAGGTPPLAAAVLLTEHLLVAPKLPETPDARGLAGADGGQNCEQDARHGERAMRRHNHEWADAGGAFLAGEGTPWTRMEAWTTVLPHRSFPSSSTRRRSLCSAMPGASLSRYARPRWCGQGTMLCAWVRPTAVQRS